MFLTVLNICFYDIPELRIPSSSPKFAPKFRDMPIRKWAWDQQLSVLKFPCQIPCSHHLALSFNSHFLLISLRTWPRFSFLTLWDLPLFLLSSPTTRRLFKQQRKICSLFCSPEKDCTPCVLQNIYLVVELNMAYAWTICQSPKI